MSEQTTVTVEIAGETWAVPADVAKQAGLISRQPHFAAGEPEHYVMLAMDELGPADAKFILLRAIRLRADAFVRQLELRVAETEVRASETHLHAARVERQAAMLRCRAAGVSAEISKDGE